MTLQTNGSTTAIHGRQSFASQSQCQRTATIFPLEQSPAQSARVEFYEAVRRASEHRLSDRVRGLRLRCGAGELVGEGEVFSQFALLLRDLSSCIDIQYSPSPSFWDSSLVHQSDIMGANRLHARLARPLKPFSAPLIV